MDTYLTRLLRFTVAKTAALLHVHVCVFIFTTLDFLPKRCWVHKGLFWVDVKHHPGILLCGVHCLWLSYEGALVNIRSWNVSWLAGTPVSFSCHLPGDFSGALFTKCLFNSVNYIIFSNDFPGFGLDLVTRVIVGF